MREQVRLEIRSLYLIGLRRGLIKEMNLINKIDQDILIMR